MDSFKFYWRLWLAVVACLGITLILAFATCCNGQELPLSAAPSCSTDDDDEGMCMTCLGRIMVEANEEYARVQAGGSAQQVLPATAPPRPVPVYVQVCPDCGSADCWKVTGEQPQYITQEREEISAGAAIGIVAILMKLLFSGCGK